MYFPFLRGKQFELLALRELIDLPLNPEKLIPIIEPVKTSTVSLKTAFSKLNSANIRVQLIINPEFGELKSKPEHIIEFIEKERQAGLDNIIPSFLINNDRDFDLVMKIIAVNGYDESGFALIHLNQIGKTDLLSKLTKETNCLFNTIQVNHLFALRRKYRNVALLNDGFKKQRKNADYAINDDEVFSSDYFFYKDEGCVAFSDYQANGYDYVEGGMLPWAVAIHLTYKDPHSEDIRIKHFVSDTNDGIEDPAGKFFEALSKLVDFVNRHKFDGIAIRQFKDYHKRQAFPGLGVIKKLSIMNHIELVQGLI